MTNTSVDKKAGILLHISSLPSGNLGKDAYLFIDFLNSVNASVWQTLPINMPACDSPYQCISTHAGNPDFICLEQLVAQALISEEEATLPKNQALSIACQNCLASDEQDDFLAFCENEAFWLIDFAYFLLLRKQFDCLCWHNWPEAYKQRERQALRKLSNIHAEELNIIQFTQYIFFKQWAALKSYAEEKHVRLFGDIPIFVAYDSADVWAQPNLFKLDSEKEMTVVAGVPPDYFSETGQRWGNPHYDWEAMQAEDFHWWLARIETHSRLFHMLRIDHFRGLEAAWEIPAEEPNAIKGKWETAPGHALLSQIQRYFPDVELIAEDLGIITDEVNALRLEFNLPGMKILQFAFGGDDNNPYLPNNIEVNSITYTGTHDNDTTLGWYESLSEEDLKHVEAFYGIKETDTPLNMPNALIETAMQTQSKLVILPMQDVLGLDSSHRMNIPGTVEGNWQWRFDWEQLNAQHIHQLKAVIHNNHRQ